MALIKITDVSVDSADNAALEYGYLYKDLFLDLETSVYYNQQFIFMENWIRFKYWSKQW